MSTENKILFDCNKKLFLYSGAGVGPSAGGSPGASGQWLPAGQGN